MHDSIVYVTHLNWTTLFSGGLAREQPHRKGSSCLTEGRLMGPRNNWHCAQIGAFPKYIPARQDSKIANHTGLRCFKSLTACGRPCHELLLGPVNGNHLAGSESGGVGGDLYRVGSIYTRTDIHGFCLCLYVGYLKPDTDNFIHVLFENNEEQTAAMAY